MKNFEQLKKLLDEEYLKKNSEENLASFADPIIIAREHKDIYISLLAALFAYGSAKQILKFLQGLDFAFLKVSDEEIKKELKGKIYRFQNEEDVQNIFITVKRLQDFDIQELFLKEMEKSGNILDGISALISLLYSLNSYESSGYKFFFGSNFEGKTKSTYKRYNMFLRWMIRKKDIDLGLFPKLSPSKLLLPLDVHTHKVSLALGLCRRKSYDFKAVMEITENLRSFDAEDPIKYDFALYRIGQSGEMKKFLKLLN